MKSVAYCFVTDGRDAAIHGYAVTELRRSIPDAKVITVSDGSYKEPLPEEELLDCKPEFERVFGAYDPGAAYTGTPTIAFSRLILPEITGSRFDRLVYLDNDAIVISSRFSDAAWTDLGDTDVAACAMQNDLGSRNRLRKLSGSDVRCYYNPGVLVMNGKATGDVESRLKAGYSKYIEDKGMKGSVADVLSAYMRVKRLDCQFNMVLPGVLDPNARCVHLSGRVKSWMLPLLTSGILRFKTT